MGKNEKPIEISIQNYSNLLYGYGYGYIFSFGFNYRAP